MAETKLKRLAEWCVKALRIVTPLVIIAAVILTVVCRDKGLFWGAYHASPLAERFFILIGADVNHRGSYAAPPLVAACYSGDPETVKTLLDNGANINLTNACGETGLILATNYGHLALVRLLLARGAAVDPTMCHSLSALGWAALQGHPEILRELLAKGAEVNPPAYREMLPLTLAAMAHGSIPLDKRTAVMQLLIDNGADVNAEDVRGRTALARACAAGRLDATRFFLDKGAKINQRLGIPRNALASAAGKGHLDCVKLVLEKLPEASPAVEDFAPALLAAKYAKRSSTLAALLERCGEIALATSQGRPKLSELFQREFPDIIEFLATQRTALANELATAGLLTALENRDAASVELLLDKDVDPNAGLGDGWTPLMSAVLSGPKSQVVVKMLLDRGADVHAATPGGWSALSLAVCVGTPEMINLLLERGKGLGKDPKAPSRLLSMAKHRMETALGQEECLRAVVSDPIGDSFSGGRSAEKIVEIIEQQVRGR